MLHCCELMKIFSYTRNVGYIIFIIYIMLYISTITVLHTEIFEMSCEVGVVCGLPPTNLPSQTSDTAGTVQSQD